MELPPLPSKKPVPGIRFSPAARASPFTLTPGFSQNEASSVETVAAMRYGEIWSRWTGWRRPEVSSMYW